MALTLATRLSGPDDAELAALAEHIECRAWLDLLDALPPSLRHASGITVKEIGGAVVFSSRALHNPLFNRVIGLGERVSVTAEHVSALMDHYWDLGVENYFVHVGPYSRPARLGRLLQDHGLALYRRSWVKMMRPARPAPRATTSLDIRPARQDDVAALASIIGPAFDLSQTGAELFTTLVGRPRWRVFVAESQGEIAAAGGLYMEGETGYLAFAATRPEFRGRGAQRSLMQARIDAAVDAGCHWIATETGFPLTADEPNPSYRNMLWAGFRAVVLRDNYSLPGVVWNHGTTSH